MADVKSLIEQVRSKLTDEQLSEVGSILKGIENEVNELSSNLTAANTESKSRKLKIRDLETKVEDFEVEKTVWNRIKQEYEDKLNDTTLKTKLDELQKYKSEQLKKQRDKFINAYNEISEHQNWEKAQSMYNIPTEKDEEGNLKWDLITDEQMEKNLFKFEEHSNLELFGEMKNPSPDPTKGVKFKTGDVPSLEECQNLRKKFGAGSPEYRAAYQKYSNAKQYE